MVFPRIWFTKQTSQYRAQDHYACTLKISFFRMRNENQEKKEKRKKEKQEGKERKKENPSSQWVTEQFHLTVKVLFTYF